MSDSWCHKQSWPIFSIHLYTNSTRWLVAHVSTYTSPHIIHHSFVPTVPSGPPLNFSAETTSPWSLSFSWEPPYPEHWNGILLGYVINVTTAYTGATVQLFSGMAASTFSGNGLFDPYTVYECSIAAFTQVGTGPDSTVVTVRTLEYGK